MVPEFYQTVTCYGITIIRFLSPHLSHFFILHQIAREAEAAVFHRQLFEELRRTSHLTRDPTESVAIGAVEASFKCCASAIVVLTKTGRSEISQ